MSPGIQPAKKVRVAVIGGGDFGRNHARVYRELPDTDLIAIVDPNLDRAARLASEFSARVFPDIESLAGQVDAASVAVPTVEHARVGCQLLEQGIDVLVEKPMAASTAEADELIAAASRAGRVLQVGHLERFNPAIVALMPVLNHPLYFEVHRLGVFSPRSLDIDVVYDVMIHDLDILLALVDAPVMNVKAVGIPVVTDKIDIAHARLDFETGAVANVTASRVSTERVRKLRFFQQHEYISVDFTRQDALRVRVAEPVRTSSTITANNGTAFNPKFDFATLPAQREEPLRAELRAFLECVRTRQTPLVNGVSGRRALALADQVMAGILEHGRRVQLGAFAAPRANS